MYSPWADPGCQVRMDVVTWMHTLSSSDVRRFWTVFAEAFTAEAREHNASCTKFSVPDFLNFLIASDQA